MKRWRRGWFFVMDIISSRHDIWKSRFGKEPPVQSSGLLLCGYLILDSLVNPTRPEQSRIQTVNMIGLWIRQLNRTLNGTQRNMETYRCEKQFTVFTIDTIDGIQQTWERDFGMWSHAEWWWTDPVVNRKILLLYFFRIFSWRKSAIDIFDQQ